MVHFCVAVNCTTKSGDKFENGDACFHRFPLQDPERLQQWIDAIGRSDWRPTEYSRICRKHFKDEDYMLCSGTQRKRLIPTAIPSIFPSTESTTSKYSRKRLIDQTRTTSNEACVSMTMMSREKAKSSGYTGIKAEKPIVKKTTKGKKECSDCIVISSASSSSSLSASDFSDFEEDPETIKRQIKSMRRAARYNSPDIRQPSFTSGTTVASKSGQKPLLSVGSQTLEVGDDSQDFVELDDISSEESEKYIKTSPCRRRMKLIDLKPSKLSLQNGRTTKMDDMKRKLELECDEQHVWKKPKTKRHLRRSRRLMENEGSVFCPANLQEGHNKRLWPTHGMHERPVWPDCVDLRQMIAENSCELLYYVIDYVFESCCKEQSDGELFELLYTTAVMYCKLCDVNPEFFISFMNSLCAEKNGKDESILCFTTLA